MRQRLSLAAIAGTILASAAMAQNTEPAGLDPTGVADNSAALNAAIATGQTVVLPRGVFHLTHMLALQPGQRLVCAGRTVSVLTVGPDFSPTDPAVIQLANVEPGAEIENCGISFAQSNLQPLRSAFRTLAQGCTLDHGRTPGTGCIYPPAIYAPNASRFRIDHVRISGAWDGVSAPGNPGGFWINDLEVGALNVGLQYDGALDFCHVNGFHAWPFGLQGYTPVYGDGSTIAARIGRCDGQMLQDLAVSEAKLVVTGPAEITNLTLDGDHADLVVDAGASPGPAIVQVANWASSKVYPADSAIQLRSGKLTLQNGYMFGGQAPGVPMMEVTGGTALVDGAVFEPKSLDSPVLRVSGGTLVGRGLLFDPFATSPGAPAVPMAGAFTQPFVVQIAGGVLDLRGAKWVPAGPGKPGVAVSVARDNPGTVVQDNDFGGWIYTPAAPEQPRPAGRRRPRG